MRVKLLSVILGGVSISLLTLFAGGNTVFAQPPIPHPLEEREQCLLCHQVGGPGVGVPGEAGLPTSHEAYSESLCSACHSTEIGSLLRTSVPTSGSGSPWAFLISLGALLSGSGVALGLRGSGAVHSRGKRRE